MPFSAAQCAATTVLGRPSSTAPKLSATAVGNGPQSSGSVALAGSGAAALGRALGAAGLLALTVPCAGFTASAPAITAAVAAATSTQCRTLVLALPTGGPTCCSVICTVSTASSTRQSPPRVGWQ
ncbi:hypothetical protein ACFQ0T_06265 [Kitasatospora gansuensis]